MGGGIDKKPGGGSLVHDTLDSPAAPGGPGKRTLTEQLPHVEKPAQPDAGQLPPKLLGPNPDAPAPTRTLILPDADHPARRDGEGEQVIQTGQQSGPGQATPLRGKSWHSLAAVTESVTIEDSNGDTLHLDITYRIESRPPEIGDVPDMWIHTERKALLTIGSGEHAGATIVGQARLRLAPGEALDPKTAISKASVGAHHWAQVYLAEAAQHVSVLGPDGRASLFADASGDDVLAYGDPLRMLVGLKNILKQQHVAGHGAEVAKIHARGARLLAKAKQGRVVLEREIESVGSHHDPNPGQIAPVRFLIGDIEAWLAATKQAGRDNTEDARLLNQAHGELARLLDAAEHARAPKRDQLDDALMAPVRFAERTAEGIVEVGAMAIDAVVLGVDAVGKATGIGTFDYHPISKYGKAIDASGASTTRALVTMVNGFADAWSDAIERARHGDYRSLTDVGVDTLLLIDGARTGGTIALEKADALVGKLSNVARSARALAGEMTADARSIAAAMADGADAFAAKLRAGGMQMSTAGDGGGPSLGLGGVSAETLAEAARAAKDAFKDRRAAHEAPTHAEQSTGTTDTPAPAESFPDSSQATPTAVPKATPQVAVARHELARRFGERAAARLASVVGDPKLPNFVAKLESLSLTLDESGATGSYRWGGTGTLEGAASGGGVRATKTNDPHTGLRTLNIEGINGDSIKLAERGRYADVRVRPTALTPEESGVLQKLFADHGITDEIAKAKLYEAIENARVRDPSLDVAAAISKDVAPMLKEVGTAAKKQSVGNETTTQDVLAAQGTLPLGPEAHGRQIAQAQAYVASGILEDPAFQSARTLAEGRDALSQKTLIETGRQRAESGGSRHGKVLTKIQFIGDLFVDESSTNRYRSKTTGKEITKTDVAPDVDVAYVVATGDKLNVEYVGGAKIGKPSTSAKALADAKIQNARNKVAIQAGDRRFKTTTRNGDLVWAEVKKVTAVDEGGGKIDITGKLTMDPAAPLETIGAPGMSGFDATMPIEDSKSLDRIVEAIWRIAELRNR